MLKNTGTGEEGFAFSNAEKLRVELKITDVTKTKKNLWQNRRKPATQS